MTRYTVYDHYLQRAVEHFKDQDRLLSFLHATNRIGQSVEDYTILFDGNYLMVGLDTKLFAWFRESFKHELACRMKGSDIMGIEEFLDGYGWSISYLDTGVEGVIDYNRYVAAMRKGDQVYSESGATKLEALAKAFVSADWSPPAWRG